MMPIWTVRNRCCMKFEKSVPQSSILTNRLIHPLLYSNKELKYSINDVFTTNARRCGNNWKPIISEIGRKRKIDITITGTVNNHCMVYDRYVYDPSVDEYVPDDYDYLDEINPEIDLMGKVINFTFFNVRIKRNPDAKLYIDNITGLYDFIKPILVNDGMMNFNDYDNIIISFDELKTILCNRQETVKVKRTDRYNGDWIIKYNKGDNDGD